MALKPLALYELTEDVLGCVCRALTRAAEEIDGQPGCPCRSCVVPGAVAWDDCTDPCGGGTSGAGGQLTVSYARMYTSTLTTFPIEDLIVHTKKGCKAPPSTATEVVVTLLRCAPGLTDGGCPPTCEEQAEAARILHVDAITVYNALLCCLADDGTRRGRSFAMGQQKALGPQGGCVGIEQRVTVGLPSCLTCPDEESR